MPVPGTGLSLKKGIGIGLQEPTEAKLPVPVGSSNLEAVGSCLDLGCALSAVVSHLLINLNYSLKKSLAFFEILEFGLQLLVILSTWGRAETDS